jgi:hypothetical protein
MKVTLLPGIAEISGSIKQKNGNKIVFMTRTNSQGKRETRAYMRDKSSYQRTGKPSKKELNARSIFTLRQAYVTELLTSGKVSSRAEAWKLAKLAYPVDGTAGQ